MNNKKDIPAGSYFDDENLNNAFNEFIEFRKQIKKAMTEQAIVRSVNKLNKFSCSNQEKIEAIDKSIVNGWTDIYEPKGDKRQDARKVADF